MGKEELDQVTAYDFQSKNLNGSMRDCYFYAKSKGKSSRERSFVHVSFLLVSLVPADLGYGESAWFRCPLTTGTLKSAGSTEKGESADSSLHQLQGKPDIRAPMPSKGFHV